MLALHGAIDAGDADASLFCPQVYLMMYLFASQTSTRVQVSNTVQYELLL